MVLEKCDRDLRAWLRTARQETSASGEPWGVESFRWAPTAFWDVQCVRVEWLVHQPRVLRHSDLPTTRLNQEQQRPCWSALLPMCFLLLLLLLSTA